MIRSLVVVGAIFSLCCVASAAAWDHPWDHPWKDGPVPAELVSSATACVRATVGDTLFDKYFTPNGGGPLGPEFFRVSFSYRPAVFDSFSATVDVAIDSLSQCLFMTGAPHWRPAPECSAHPERCIIVVSPKYAVEIADAAGLGVHEGKLSVDLHVRKDRQGLVWRVTRDNCDEMGAGVCGWCYQVDVVTGDVISIGTSTSFY